MAFPDEILRELMDADPFVSDLEGGVWGFDGERVTLDGDFSADELTKIAQYMVAADVLAKMYQEAHKEEKEEETDSG